MLTGLCAAADFVPNFVPPSIKPDMGDQSCWFSSEYRSRKSPSPAEFAKTHQLYF